MTVYEFYEQVLPLLIILNKISAVIIGLAFSIGSVMAHRWLLKNIPDFDNEPSIMVFLGLVFGSGPFFVLAAFVDEMGIIGLSMLTVACLNPLVSVTVDLVRNREQSE